MERKKGRLALLSDGQRPDRVPISLSLGAYGAKVCEVPYKELLLNPLAAFEANQWVKKAFPQDGSPGYSIPNGVCWDFGGELNFPDGINGWPTVRRFPVGSEADLDKLEIPDPRKAPAAQLGLEYTRIRYRAGQRGGTLMAMSPFRAAFYLADGERILRWILCRPELVHQLCEISLEYSLRVARMYAAEFGTEGWSAMFTYPTESHGMISPKHFKQFSAPYAQRLHQELVKIGFRTFKEHPCGNHRHNLWFWRDQLDLPEHTTISVGKDMPIEEIDAFFGSRFVIGGNVDSVKLVSAPASAVYEEAKDVIQRMKHRPGGYILMAACSITNAVPPANLLAMIQAVEDYGYYEEGKCPVGGDG